MRIVAALLACLLLALPAAAQKRIALSFDDAPRGAGAFLDPDARAKKLTAALKRAGLKQAVFFVNPGNIGKPGHGDGAANLDRYVKAGHVLANHSWSHPRLGSTDADAYLADLDRAEAWLKARPGYRPWFRFPFLDEGGKDKVKRDAIRAGLKARGLINGYVTAESSDWNIESLTIAARQAGKTIDMKALRDLYVESHVEAAEFYDALAVRTLGRSPAHVMLLHETDIAALFIGDLVRGLKAKGWTIISADEAYADPLRDAAPDTPHAQGTLIEALAWEKGLPAPRWYERNDLRIANPLFARRVLGETPAP
ncbi:MULTISPECIES: polysaccharide deacetylase family protein [unclassified Sphingomonas]|uniref:polysaccharide deacetylase family protein n=1 Tax=unclassified Sphingomonas TaxID=196159 RepID=UPI0021512956|nr:MULTISPECIES: polysaccharide deacetylase family protein [unclassified Sphingomonas]MCR5869357.1 polysaccharide deacetylase family protein [Sphingomonas sp. J344]UUX98913.1 polysaccharide deacetylase family protein [Sphingomonas sp. J315]